jgi:putative salt-induced outer membrane protein
MGVMVRAGYVGAAAVLLGAGPACAALAPNMRAMLDTAIASGNEAEVDILAKYIKRTSAADADEVDALVRDHRQKLASARDEKLREQSVLEGWKGEGQLGGSQTSGNSGTLGLSAGLKLARSGLHWRSSLRAGADFERSRGATSRNQQVLALESNYLISARLFTVLTAQYDRDRFAGYDDRIALSAGMGYRVVQGPQLNIDLKAGPAWRKTNYTVADSASDLTGSTAINAKWQASPRISLTEDATMLAATNTSVTTITALSLKVTRALSTRAAYQMTYNSHPAANFKQLDTLSRVTLVYGF